tara:strand:+ start:8607 stop:9185 length:579 start_codon:yes stop_codon:yes gene_type:complete
MKDDYNGIEIYDGIFSADYCNEVIRHFKMMSKLKKTYTRNSLQHNSDERVTFDWAHNNKQYHYDYKLVEHFYTLLHDTYTNLYQEKYDILKNSEEHSPKGMSVQKTSPHQGYHAWHQESGDIGSSTRVVNYMLYLNTVKNGGDTEFLYQGVKLSPKQGSLVFFPTAYTHPHRGNPIYEGEKYIITGWYTYDR